MLKVKSKKEIYNDEDSRKVVHLAAQTLGSSLSLSTVQDTLCNTAMHVLCNVLKHYIRHIYIYITACSA
jgi:hypothetical protein